MKELIISSIVSAMTINKCFINNSLDVSLSHGGDNSLRPVLIYPEYILNTNFSSSMKADKNSSSAPFSSIF